MLFTKFYIIFPIQINTFRIPLLFTNTFTRLLIARMILCTVYLLIGGIMNMYFAIVQHYFLILCYMYN